MKNGSMAMLSKSEVEKLLIAEEIKIDYTFSHLDGGAPKYLCGGQAADVSNQELPATRMFNNGFFGDRLRLTLGPIVMTHCPQHYSKRSSYNGRPGLIDLRESNNQIILEPHEVISANTNEHIVLGGKIGAVILPRLRNADAGLLYIPSYIDPYWDGILQAVIVNLTDHKQFLNLCEGIAICRFYRVDGTVSPDARRSFPGKSHHFGQSWNKILEDGAEPFPRRKQPAPQSKLRQLYGDVRFWVSTHWRILEGLGFTAGALFIAYYVGIFSAQIGRLDRTEKTVLSVDKQLAQVAQVEIPNLKHSIDQLTTSRIRSGTAALNVYSGSTTATSVFDVSQEARAGCCVWLNPVDGGIQYTSLQGRAEPSPANPKNTQVTIELRLSRPGPARSVSVHWLLLN